MSKVSISYACLALLFPPLLFAQACHTDTIAQTTPDTQFIVHGDGTVTDTSTALMWKQCIEGLSGNNCSSGILNEQNWSGALEIAQNTNNSGGFAGYADWRLPNQAELASLLEDQCIEPSINSNVFPNTVNKFLWSSSPDYNNDTATWFVDFKHGATGTITREQTWPSRLVRSVQ
jgi:Protein of unknown function (DUF1566)